MTGTLQNRVVLALALAVAALAGGPARAGIIGPYTPDANTLHLYHFNETSGGTAYDAATSGAIDLTGRWTYSSSRNATYQAGVGGTQGSAAYPGFGYSFYATPDGGPPGQLAASGPSYSSQSAWQGTDGAFTYEAIVKVTSISDGNYREMIARDGYGEAGATRDFQFRLNGDGKLNFTYWDAGSAIHTFLSASISNFDQANWYHAAVTYDGSSTLKFYWTAMSGTATAAQQLGGNVSMTQDIRANGTGPTTVGGWNAYDSAGMGVGSIDEVRVSSIARGVDQMMFGIAFEPGAAVAEPAALGLWLLGLPMLLRRHR